jgi:hypothetical protein
MNKKLSPSPAMFALITGRWVSQLIYVAAKLDLADHLNRGPRTVEQLAAATEVPAPALYRVLRTLASCGVFAETKNKRFKLTPLAAKLQRTAPGSMHAVALLFEDRFVRDPWAQLLHGIKTGEVPFLTAHGISPFQYLEEHPETLKIFGEAMSSVSSSENPAISAAYRFSEMETVVDVGGGHGSLLGAILKANPKLKGVLFDQPSVCARAKQDRHVTPKGIAERCTLQSGDFFERVPEGGDGYMMKRVLHDWDNERCATILSNCRSAMTKKGRVLVIDSVIRPGNEPDRGKLLDMQMLVMGGRERTKQEFAKLFQDAGLKLNRVVPTKCPLSIVEGVRA